MQSFINLTYLTNDYYLSGYTKTIRIPESFLTLDETFEFMNGYHRQDNLKYQNLYDKTASLISNDIKNYIPAREGLIFELNDDITILIRYKYNVWGCHFKRLLKDPCPIKYIVGDDNFRESFDIEDLGTTILMNDDNIESVLRILSIINLQICVYYRIRKFAN
jgi:hypothetical protein